MNNKIKKISSIALFSTILTVGVGVVPVINNPIVHAEEVHSVATDFIKTPVDNVLSSKTSIRVNQLNAYYPNVIQKANGDKSVVLNIDSPFFDEQKDSDDEDSLIFPKWNVYPAPFLVKHDFKAGEKLIITQTIKDPLKIKQLDKFTETSKKIHLNSLQRSAFIFFDENEENQVNTKPDKVDMKINDDKTELTNIYEFTVPQDRPYLRAIIDKSYIGDRNIVSKNSYSYNAIKNAIKDNQLIDVASATVSITDDKGTQIVEPFSDVNIKATNNQQLAVDESKQYFNLIGLDFPDESTPSKYVNSVEGDQSIKANILNGGITGGIVNPEVGKDLAIQDVDFGKLSIGQVINPVKEDTMVSVRDWTGGNGWKLTAQHKYADRNQSLQLGVQVNNGNKVDLSDQAQLVTKGESQLETITQGGEYSATWGTHPTAGEFNNVIEWNLSANVTE